jgi:hypothetical protein
VTRRAASAGIRVGGLARARLPTQMRTDTHSG